MTPRLPPMADCRDCGDPIRFVKLPSGRQIPVNPKPDADHGAVVAHLAGHRLVGYVLSHDRVWSPRFPYRFRAHGATCTARANDREAARQARVPPTDPALF